LPGLGPMSRASTTDDSTADPSTSRQQLGVASRPAIPDELGENRRGHCRPPTITSRWRDGDRFCSRKDGAAKGWRIETYDYDRQRDSPRDAFGELAAVGAAG
jgi:hypothetical protein